MKIKNLILIILVCMAIFIAGCSDGSSEDMGQSVDGVEEDTDSDCNSMSEGPRKILCKAMEKEDISICDDIEGRFKDECYVVLAEIVHDKSLVSYCEKTDSMDNGKICRALILENAENCFDWPQGDGLGTSLSVRDCIDLTARKLQSKETCGYFETKKEQILAICGDTSDCEGQWLDGASDHVDRCKENI